MHVRLFDCLRVSVCLLVAVCSLLCLVLRASLFVVVVLLGFVACRLCMFKFSFAS